MTTGIGGVKEIRQGAKYHPVVASIVYYSADFFSPKLLTSH
jgi:hypothetical protein